jgi:hypothetical protein
MAKQADTTKSRALRKCRFESCDRTVGTKGAKGLCPAHYRQSKVGELRPIIKKMRRVPGAVCLVDGCEKRDGRFSAGMCNAHYLRSYRHGDPNILLKTQDGEPAKWIKSMVGFSGTECLTWPFARDPGGYPCKHTFDGKPIRAHRVMCILVHGDPPFPKAEAAHSCGNGNLGCVNPNHLSWKTHAENMADLAIHYRERRR